MPVPQEDVTTVNAGLPLLWDMAELSERAVLEPRSKWNGALSLQVVSFEEGNQSHRMNTLSPKQRNKWNGALSRHIVLFGERK